MTSQGKDSNIDDLLKAFQTTLPYFQKVLPLDGMLAVTDKEKFLYYLSGKEIDTKITAGNRLPPSGGVSRCLDTGEKIILLVPKEVYGIPVKSTTVPITYENGNVIGAGSTLQLKRHG
ncbi:hypothetical protein GJ688_08485 [Heliobacillus mobilis]|uniref:Uncharacterized protein n=1 Tax=Heliobacterium mobile TaxID=28064 RepID=A0A6I3SJC9_HELMO|nr:hypothetical protein [Heliobacterium mobile]MTV49014.1 hypothetical protein [Heliobacterium mobile]